MGIAVCVSDGMAQQVSLGIGLKSLLGFLNVHQLIDNTFPYIPQDQLLSIERRNAR